ncbi:hypothetical protein [Moorena sp. SIO2C4]|nr:hypothetical protein [Moorena sp. SIO2C4]NES45812.1 hypothetical protein [Moorena sp. SIO2C4]
MAVGHATRMATLREQRLAEGLGRWPRYANGHATRTALWHRLLACDCD